MLELGVITELRNDIDELLNSSEALLQRGVFVFD